MASSCDVNVVAWSLRSGLASVNGVITSGRSELSNVKKTNEPCRPDPESFEHATPTSAMHISSAAPRRSDRVPSSTSPSMPPVPSRAIAR